MNHKRKQDIVETVLTHDIGLVSTVKARATCLGWIRVQLGTERVVYQLRAATMRELREFITVKLAAIANNNYVSQCDLDYGIVYCD